MIDVIIPAYNAHETICETLSSIVLQSIKDQLNVYIVNDCSKKDYSKEIKRFSKVLNIKEIKRQDTDVSASMIRNGIRNNHMDVLDLLYPGISELDIKHIIEKVNEHNPNNKKTSN